jgi:di/tricarboxylate transporter/CRP-like cAMP-binding protein
MNIEDIALFRGLSSVDLAKVLGKLERKSLPQDEVLFRFGEPGDKMYIVLSGGIGLFIHNPDGTQRALTALGAGAVFGEMALLTGEPRSATARSTEATELYVINGETFQQLIGKHPSMSAYFIGLLSGRLTDTNSRLAQSLESEAARLRQAKAEWPQVVVEALTAAAVLPFAHYALLEHRLNTQGLDAVISAHATAFHYIKRDEKHPFHFSVLAGARQELAKAFTDKYGPAAKAAWIEEASRYYRELGDWSAAAAVLAGGDGSGWETLLADLNRCFLDRRSSSSHSEEAPQNAEKKRKRKQRNSSTTPAPPLPPFAELLEACPDKYICQWPELLLAYLNSCLSQQREEGFIRLQAILEQYPESFTTEHTIAMYEWAAEWCRRAGRHQKALEYAALAESPPDSEGTRPAGSLAAAGSRWRSGVTRRLAFNAGVLPGGRTIQLIVAVLLALLSLLYFHFAPPIAGFTRQGMDFAGIGIAAVLMWIIRIIPDYVVALLMTLLWVATGIAEPAEALSGFASPSWLYMLFVLALGAAIAKSGLLYRFSLLALKLFPSSYRGQFWGLIASGILLNPLLPSSSAKVGLGVPVARTLSEAMGYADRSRAMAGLSLTAMVFYGFTAPFVLTGSYSNVLALGLTGSTSAISWFQWFLYALPAFVLFSIGMAIYLGWTFRRKEAGKPISAEVLEEQLKLLGGFTRVEKITAAAAAGSILLMMLEPLHGIDYVWIMLLGFVMLAATGVLDEQTLKSGIDWPFLLFIGIAFSFGEVAQQVGVVDGLTELLGDRLAVFTASPVLFLLAIVLLSFVVTLVVRDDAALILLVVSTVHLAANAGIHPWVTVFVILLSTDPFFFAYQSPTYLTAYYSAEGKSFTHRQGQLTALGYGVVVLLLTAACVPYWKWLGLIS